MQAVSSKASKTLI